MPLSEAIYVIKQRAPEWRISLYERDHDKWEAVLARNFKNVTEKGPHEIRVAEADPPLKALVNVANKAAGVFSPISVDSRLEAYTNTVLAAYRNYSRGYK